MQVPQQPRWLDEQERLAWVALVGVLTRLPASLDAQLQRDAGVSHFEYQVLSWLSMSEGRTRRMGELAEVANSSMSRLSHVASRLEKQGWLTRHPDPADGRCTLATLTEDGWRKVVATAPGHVEQVRRVVLDPLSEAQVEQLREIGSLVQRAVEDDLSGPRAPRTACGDVVADT